jgi:TRAP-type C4-dicarboxylate transport system substrate-binding protein
LKKEGKKTKGKKLGLLVSIVTVVLLVSLVMFPGCKPAEPDVYEWRIQSGYPRGDVSMELLNDFAAAAEKKSGGRLTIRDANHPPHPWLFHG